MELTHSFTVPVGVDQAFEVLTDIERVAPCMPGASIESVEGDEFTGRVKVKVGPMQITYRGKAKYKELDREQHRAIIEARGQEMRGSGTANATVTASLLEKGDQTEVTVVSALSITGRPAQFGRGVMNEVGAKLLGQFADCLSTRLAGDDQADADDTADVDDTTELPRASASPGSNGSGGLTERDITQVAGVATTQPASVPEPAAAAPPPAPDAVGASAQPTAREAPRETWSPSSSEESIDLFSVAGPSIVKRLVPLAAVLVLLLLWRRRRSH